MKNGDIQNFKLSNSCSAGNGMLLQAMADQFGLPVTEYAETAFKAELAPKFSYGCAVFLDTDRVNFQKEGFQKEELLAGSPRCCRRTSGSTWCRSPAWPPWGGSSCCRAARNTTSPRSRPRSTTSSERVPGAEVFVHPHTGEAGALGAAFETLRRYKRTGKTRFIGIDAAARSRIFDAQGRRRRPVTSVRTSASAPSSTPSARTAAPRATSRASPARRARSRAKRPCSTSSPSARRSRHAVPEPGRVRGARAFQHFYEPEPTPSGGHAAGRHRGGEGLFRSNAATITRAFAALERRRRDGSAAPGIGMPRVLNMYSTAPFFRTYFEALGIPKKNVVFSEPTNEEMWVEGGKYGSIDPCFPSKVVQAHVHNLLFRKHEPEEGRALTHIFFPILTHVPSFVKDTMDNASCPIVAGTPKVMKAAFTKEVDFFAQRKIEYLDPALTFAEPHLTARRMFETWGERLGITEDESDHACRQGLKRPRGLRRRPAGQGPRDPRDGRSRGPHRPARAQPPVPLGPGTEPRHSRGVPGARLSDREHPLDPRRTAKYLDPVLRQGAGRGTEDQLAAGAQPHLARELPDQQRAEGLGGQLRRRTIPTSRSSISRASSVATTHRPTA